MTSAIEQPTILITGAAKRLGRATAHAFVQRGCHVAIHYNSSTQQAEQLQDELLNIRKQCCTLIQADISRQSSLPKILNKTLSQFGRLDHLVNNASIFYPTPLACRRNENNNENNLAFIQTNYLAAKQLSLLAAPYLAKQQGSIVNLIDIYADAGLTEHCFYVASKSALKATTQQHAKMMSPHVRVNGVSPGAILWPDIETTTNSKTTTIKTTGDSTTNDRTFDNSMLNNTLGNNTLNSNTPSASKKQSILQNTALKHLGHPDNIAATIVYLALDANYTTGSVINVDGGRRDYL